MKRFIQNNMKFISVNLDQMQAFIIINNAGMKINAGVNAKNRLIKRYMIKDLFKTQIISNVDVINCVMLGSIQTRKIVNADKYQLISQLKNTLVKIALAENKNNHKRSSCTLYIVSFSIVFTITVRIGTYFVHHKQMNHNKKTDCKEKLYERLFKKLSQHN